MSNRTVKANDETGLWDVRDSAGWKIADFESESNAQEFATAPELLDALKQAVAQLYQDAGEDVGSGRYAHLDTLIAEAEGTDED